MPRRSLGEFSMGPLVWSSFGIDDDGVGLRKERYGFFELDKSRIHFPFSFLSRGERKRSTILWTYTTPIL